MRVTTNTSKLHVYVQKRMNEYFTLYMNRLTEKPNANGKQVYYC